MHETIIPVLTKLTIEEPEKWFKHVNRLQRIMNSTNTRSTKFTPFEVLIGVKMKQKEDLKIRHLLEDELREQFIDERETLRNEAKENILRCRMKTRNSTINIVNSLITTNQVTQFRYSVHSSELD
ncbi:uncharacterized protein TNCV_1079031 [Trichonephila clavipes]|nr:uncharacterized protein TNCV_1079031 [Trichonephila clavipes]